MNATHLRWTMAIGLFLLASMQAGASTFAIYERAVLPNYSVSDSEMLFQVKNNFNDPLDTYHVDFVQRRWTRYNEFGAVSGTWAAEHDALINPATPEKVICLAGPAAVAGCAALFVVVAPTSWVMCQSNIEAAMRRADRRCRSMIPGSRGALIHNTGVCGFNMAKGCLPPLPTLGATIEP